MKKTLIQIIFITILLTFINCGERNKHMQDNYDGPEALHWLEQNKNVYALASNHFESTIKVIEFVKLLYSKGAKEVRISKESIRDDEKTISNEGGPYADAIVVVLPLEKDKAKDILELCQKESDPGYDKPEIKDNMIFLWWD